MKWLFVIFGLLIQQQLKCQELFSSTDSLWDLARNFETIVKALDDFSDDVESEYVRRLVKKSLNKIKFVNNSRTIFNFNYISRRKVDEFKSENVAIKKNLKEYITNPLNAFKLIKLTYYDIEKIRKDFPEEFSWYYESIEDLIPTSNDLLGAVTGILRLQQIYRFRSEDFANGIIGDKKVRDLLTTNDIYVIGTFARQLDFKSIYFAKKYLNLTLERVEKNDYEKTEIEMMSLQLDLAKICNRTSDFEEVTRLATNVLKNHPNSVIASKLKNDSDHLRSIGYKPKKLPRNPYSDFYVRNQQYSQKKETILYSRVCRGDLKQSADVLAKLKCRFDSDSPYKKLVRSKIEEFNLDPYVVLFHDVISDSEVEVLKKIGRPGKHRGQVESEKEGVSGEVSGARVSHVSWLKDDAHQTVAKINQRISELTGLSMELAEELQLQNYGIGYYYMGFSKF